MRYTSTRSADCDLDFVQVAMSGYAPDGGMIIPKVLPQISNDTLRQWKEAKISFPDLCLELFPLFIPAELIPKEDLKQILASCFGRFRNLEIAPVNHLSAVSG